MSEGELYKKIQAILNQSWGDVKGTRKFTKEEQVYMVPLGENPDNYCTEYIIEKPEQIQKVLDEAKQDFPSGLYFAPDVNPTQKLAEILTWKKKWFGDK